MGGGGLNIGAFEHWSCDAGGVAGLDFEQAGDAFIGWGVGHEEFCECGGGGEGFYYEHVSLGVGDSEGDLFVGGFEFVEGGGEGAACADGLGAEAVGFEFT